MSFLSQLFRRFRHPTGFVGRDLEGNRFFEYPSLSDDPRRTKRVVKYAKGTHMLDYVSGHRRLAVQWTSWLTHTRPHAPTLDELHADLERQRRIRQNAAMIEARDKEEAARIAAAEQMVAPRVEEPVSRPPRHPPADTTVEADPAANATTQVPEWAIQPPETESLAGEKTRSPWKPPPSDEPQAWQPRATVRRGG